MVAEASTPLAGSGVDLVALFGPELGASPRLRGLVTTVSDGVWRPEDVPASRRTAIGVLILDGVVARDLSVAGVEATELLGEGDVVDPWSPTPDAFLPSSAHWSVLLPGRVLIIDPTLMGEAERRPRLMAGLLAGASRRANRLALHQAIAQLPRVELRLLALFWHLAGRWGRVGPSGVIVPLPLSHARLGRLVGARRPTVTLALRELGDRGHVHRREDGSWQLGATTPDDLHDTEDHEPPRRRRRPHPASPDAIERMARDLRTHVSEARARARREADVLPSNLNRLAELRARSQELVRESARLRAQYRAQYVSSGQQHGDAAREQDPGDAEV